MKRLMKKVLVTSGLVLAAGAAGLLMGVKRLLTPAQLKKVSSLLSAAVDVPALPEAPSESLKADRHFSIKRTKSEVGYVYWILEGFGEYKCFVLCDSWEEAVAQAKARLAGEEVAESSEKVLTLSAAGGVA